MKGSFDYLFGILKLLESVISKFTKSAYFNIEREIVISLYKT